MTKRWISAATVGVLGLMFTSDVGSAQAPSPNVTGMYAGANYRPYARNGGGYFFARRRSYDQAPAYYDSAPGNYGPRGSNYYAPPALTPLPEMDSRAILDVRVPANAEVLFEGDKTTQTGSNRIFASPALEPGKTFTYEIRARWAGPDGKPIEQTRQIKVQAGRRTLVDFLDRNPN